MIRTVTATGTVNPELTIIVGAAISGIIQELNCDYNTKVKKGQICAKIDPRSYQSVVDQNKAALAVAKAQLEKDKANRLPTPGSRSAALPPFCRPVVYQDAYDSPSTTRRQHTFDEATIQHKLPGYARCGAGQSRLHQHCVPCRGTGVSRNVTMG